MLLDDPTYVALAKLPRSQIAGQSPAILYFPGSLADTLGSNNKIKIKLYKKEVVIR
jgi:hypothetical protein